MATVYRNVPQGWRYVAREELLYWGLTEPLQLSGPVS